jgi:hypothetical protein
LTAARGGGLVKFLINKNNRATRQQVVEKCFNGFPAEPALNERPRLMHDVIRGEQRPVFFFGALKCGQRAGMK